MQNLNKIAIIHFIHIRPEDSGVSTLISTTKPKSPAVWACLWVDPLGMSRTPYRASEEKLSITHHAISPTPSHHHLYMIHHTIDYNVFIILQCHLKDHLCRKVT